MNKDDPSLRREVKFVANELFSNEIFAWVASSKLFLRKEFQNRVVNNIYYDTYDYDAYTDNLDGISRRTKLRYRWYGQSLTPCDGQLELKKRENAFGFKKIQIVEGLNINNSHRLLSMALRSSVPDSWVALLDYYSEPVILNRYRRSYYLSKCKKIRVTVDQEHSVFDQRLSNIINISKKANTVQYIVVEVKFHPDLTEYVSEMIADIPMRISRNSKYINSVNSVL